MKKVNPVKQAIVFFALTLGLSYLVFWGPLALFRIPAISFVDNTRGPVWAIILYIIGGFVPSLVGIFLTWKTEGSAGLRRLWGRLIQFNIGWRWHLAALAVVAVGTLGQLAIIHFLGGSFDFSLFTAQLGSVLPLLVLGPLSEEIGWRGFALDRLQTKWNPLVSSIIVGLGWGLWHGPLFAMVGTSQHELAIPYPGFLAGILALSVVFTWLHNHTAGSLWTAVFFHWIFTYAMQVMSTGVTRSFLFNWLEYVPYILIALIVMIIWKPKNSPYIGSNSVSK